MSLKINIIWPQDAYKTKPDKKNDAEECIRCWIRCKYEHLGYRELWVATGTDHSGSNRLQKMKSPHFTAEITDFKYRRVHYEHRVHIPFVLICRTRALADNAHHTEAGGLEPNSLLLGPLFDWDAATGLQAESTPHDHKARARKVAQEAVPPLPTASTRRSSIVYVRSDDQPAVGTERPQSKRSSIVYVKSGDENAPPAEGANVQRSTSGRFAQWGARAVRPLKPKANKGKVSPPPSGQSSSPTGLRPLSLLQERNTNMSTENAHGVRPLTLGRKKKLQEGMDPVAENAALAEVGNTNAGLKPLKLARSETAKKRGLLMNRAGVPDVVVRPPSASEHVGFGYSFR
ncbi:hypothetical protein PUNSTDRAFT_139546 [Punctularia strigosozonata HHB-11173 SS5]|uniref:Uncharacterized protein n=1 Tax=Punctularia strigosozonata (strain HHB-11173) TaxID=741275 RepID=R7S2I1_PUNST|nr:uncharacterized protein PUNSTDRAFT_139546 [Punctularia strigosozonata HHB-11173 SS5]EIN03456.1 hypothetical protein PUNSTDRAFT_139546 [Punctularia strigosozonata HHB-11173 SS5]